MKIRKALARAGYRAVVITALAGSGALLAAQAAVDNRVPAERPLSPGSPTELVERHGCWTGAAPADMEGQVPGHVVVTDAGVTRYGGRELVGKALTQVFDGADHGLTVHAFCR